MKRMEWMCAGAMSVALMLGAGGGIAHAQSGEESVSYDLSSKPGQPTMRLALTTQPGSDKVHGTGIVKYVVKPATLVNTMPTEFDGAVSIESPTGKASDETQVVNIAGYRPVPGMSYPSGEPNLRMILTIYPGGKTGSATYSFQPAKDAQWIDIDAASVKFVDFPYSVDG